MSRYTAHSRIYRIAWALRSRRIIGRPLFERVCMFLDTH